MTRNKQLVTAAGVRNQYMRNIVIVLALLISGCAAQQAGLQRGPLSNTEMFLESGFKQLSESNTKNAIVDFDKAIALCEGQYSNSEQKTYASRGMTETLYYMLKAAADKESAVTVSPICSEALYIRGYASLDLGQIELAEQYIQRAIEMAPVNSMYLSELGHVYHAKRDWKSALDVFTKAEEAATVYSPPELKDAELTRAKRGVGYSLIELGMLDEAEKKFRECLEINNDDKSSLKELKYIESIRGSVSTNS